MLAESHTVFCDSFLLNYLTLGNARKSCEGGDSASSVDVPEQRSVPWTAPSLGILEPASRGMVGVEAAQNELSFAQNSKIELQI